MDGLVIFVTNCSVACDRICSASSSLIGTLSTSLTRLNCGTGLYASVTMNRSSWKSTSTNWYPLALTMFFIPSNKRWSLCGMGPYPEEIFLDINALKLVSNSRLTDEPEKSNTMYTCLMAFWVAINNWKYGNDSMTAFMLLFGNNQISGPEWAGMGRDGPQPALL
jgi:hypothetical protein